MEFLQGQPIFFIVLKRQKPSSPLAFRDEGSTRFVVPPWFGVERPLGHSPPSFGPSRGQGGIHYSRFTDSARRRVQQHLDWLAPPANSLQHVQTSVLLF